LEILKKATWRSQVCSRAQTSTGLE